LPDKRLWRAWPLPCLICIAALAIGAVIVVASFHGPARPQHVFARDGSPPRVATATPAPPPPEQTADAPAGQVAPAEEAPPPPSAPLVPPVAEPAPAGEAAPSPAPPSAGAAPSPAPAAATSLFDHGQVVAFYGSPLSPGLGVLGMYPGEEMAQRLTGQARIYDDLNGDRDVIPAMDLIYGVVQAEPTENGLYVSYLPDEVVDEYIRLAEEHDLQLILDLQIGRSTVADEVAKVGRFLENPRVHVAIDPEYAVGPDGYPVYTPGLISGHDINAAQLYLDGLTKRLHLPRKMLVIHQFMEDTIMEGEVTADIPDVDLVLNMDAYGDYPDKVEKYHYFAARPYAERRSFNIFLKQDQPVAPEQDVLSLDPMPDMVMYQ